MTNNDFNGSCAEIEKYPMRHKLCHNGKVKTTGFCDNVDSVGSSGPKELAQRFWVHVMPEHTVCMSHSKNNCA